MKLWPFFKESAMIGARINFNDPMGSELFLFGIKDIERKKEHILSASFSRRFSDAWKWTAGVRIFDAAQKQTTLQGLEVLDDSDHLFVNISRFFLAIAPASYDKNQVVSFFLLFFDYYRLIDLQMNLLNDYRLHLQIPPKRSKKLPSWLDQTN